MGAGAHGESDERVGGVGDEPEQAGRREGSPAADDGDEDDGATSGVPRARASSWCSMALRRSAWIRLGEVGWPVSAAMANGGGGRSRVSSGKGLEGEGESRE